MLSSDIDSPTPVMRSYEDLWVYIWKYAKAFKQWNKSLLSDIEKNILELLLGEEWLNCSEFVSFWNVVDVSHSYFMWMWDTDEQEKLLHYLLEEYMTHRYELYEQYQKSPFVLQVSRDIRSHKASGTLGLIKVSKMLDAMGYVESNHDSLEVFMQGEKKYITADQKGKKLFQKILEHYRIHFSWKNAKDNKMPDFLIRQWEHIYIVEHKHIKEWWGWQDKQINELISFIETSEIQTNIHFVAFLDGVYFNNWIYGAEQWTKIANQLHNIEENIIKNSQNYFLNTAGFSKLFSSSI